MASATPVPGPGGGGGSGSSTDTDTTTTVVPPAPEIPPDPTSGEIVTVSRQTSENFEAIASNTELSDIGTELKNILFSFPNCRQGWKAFCLLSWSSGSLVQIMYTFNDLTPMNPLRSQVSVK